MSDYRFIEVEREGRIGIVTLNRPEKYNSWDAPMRIEVANALRALNADEAVRAVIITGAGDAFSGGQDPGDRSDEERAELLERPQHGVQRPRQPVDRAKRAPFPSGNVAILDDQHPDCQHRQSDDDHQRIARSPRPPRTAFRRRRSRAHLGPFPPCHCGTVPSTTPRRPRT